MPGGRPPIDDELKAMVRMLMSEQPRRMTVAEITANFHIGRSTIYEIVGGRRRPRKRDARRSANSAAR